jgi:TetR/AcrR family transcriptional regulator
LIKFLLNGQVLIERSEIIAESVENDLNLDHVIRIAQGAFMTDAQPDSPAKKTRIQQRRETLVLDCALDIFATYGFHGATIDQIAAKADLSKPNVLYYFKSKEHIYLSLLERTLDGWLDPFLAITVDGDPIPTLEKYVATKMDLSFETPLLSRLFAIEILNGAPQMQAAMRTSLRAMVDEKAAVLQTWMDQGKIKQVDPHHLIFSIWSITQHYADFGIQIECLLGKPPNRELAKAAVTQILLGGLKV